ncbi:MAG TPA: cytochrome C oxidase subunit IV family protein [Chthonomonadaceae bacterium]|nr:cytochrome C oxidase subunit IV family protein [Chthonomonadaceae bacterium]
MSVKTYASVYAALLVLLVLTVVAANFNFGTFNIVVALIIGVTKAVLVILYFMGVKFGTRLIWLWASIGFVWFVLLFLTLGDYITRGSVIGW